MNTSEPAKNSNGLNMNFTKISEKSSGIVTGIHLITNIPQMNPRMS